uniref:Phospholipase-like protein n=1 Tax=Tanacetum cinerariifolium TaxID=118510 RepID=A0A6L2KDC9_TANCI|nr:phospholipase-like protein [Tanacetum cinerariifolium]
MANPNVALISSPEEMSQAWFNDSAEFIKGLDAQDGTFLQDDQVDDGVGVLDSQSDDGDGVLDSQTKDVIKEASMLPTMSSNSPQARNAVVSEFFAEFDALKKEVLLIKKCKDDEFDELTKRFSNDCNPKKSDGGVSIEKKPNFSSHHNNSLNHIGGVSSEAKASSSSAHPRNDENVSHLDDNIEIDYPNAKDRYSNSQHHLHLLIKALGTKIENSSIDSIVVVPPKVDDPMLRTIKRKDDFDEADVDSYDDDYMSFFNDEEQPAKSSLNDLELQQEPDIVDVKYGILEQKANVYFLVNESKHHWCLAQLEIRTGVVTFYDSLGWVGGSRRRWWRQMKKVLPEKLTLYLLMHGIFDSKGISTDHHKITYSYVSVPFQASLYGDCRIWAKVAGTLVRQVSYKCGG